MELKELSLVELLEKSLVEMAKTELERDNTTLDFLRKKLEMMDKVVKALGPMAIGHALLLQK